jgi:hypothetical protein
MHIHDQGHLTENNFFLEIQIYMLCAGKNKNQKIKVDNFLSTNMHAEGYMNIGTAGELVWLVISVYDFKFKECFLLKI